MHIDRLDIQRYLDGELSEADSAHIESHLGICADCRGLRFEMEAEENHLDRLFERLDVETPTFDLESIRARAGRFPPPLRLAAGIVFLLVGAGAAYALPGSPLPGWIDGWTSRFSDEAFPDLAPIDRTATESPSSAVSLPATDSVLIEFALRPEAGAVEVRFGPADRVEVRSLDATARFTSDIDRLGIDHADASARFEIHLPAVITSVEIRMAGEVVLRKRGMEIESAAPADSSGIYRIPAR